MLVQFRFNNFKCFPKDTILSMVASNYYKDNLKNVVGTKQKYSLLKGAVVYGANASGKTKLFQAFDFMKDFVLHSTSDKTISNDIPIDPFRLSDETKDAPSTFEVVMLHKDIQYRYGFEISHKQVISEWLFRKKTKEISVFFRNEQEVEYNRTYIDSKIANNLLDANMMRERALFLSMLAQWNDKQCSDIRTWFAMSNVISVPQNNFAFYTLRRMQSGMKENILQMMHNADIAIDDFAINEVAKDSLPEEIQRILPPDAAEAHIIDGVKTIRMRYDRNKERAGHETFLMDADESHGTQNFFALTAPILDTLESGKVLFIDELDCGLHPMLVDKIIQLFQSERTNPKNAQLIINTHNVNLIRDDKLFRRDQIYITKKNRYGEVQLEALAKYEPKAEWNLGKQYLEGRFGGIPYINDLGHRIIKSKSHYEPENPA